MKRTYTLFSIVISLLIIATAAITSVLLRGYDVTRPDIGSEILPTQLDSYPVVILGDSLTAGVGASNPEMALGPRILTAIQNHHHEANLHNFGIAGATTTDILQDQLPRLALIPHPKVVILVVGTNDIIQQMPEGSFEENWNAILKILTSSNSQLVILNIPKFAATPAVPDNIKNQADTTTVQRNAFISQSIQTNKDLHLLDFYQLSSISLQPGSQLLSADQFHPNDAGYAQISAAITKTLEL